MKSLLIGVIVSATAFSALAEGKFLQLSLTPDIALESRGSVINGVALSIWGENEQSAFAFGFINGSQGDSSGLSWGLVNYAENYTGVQLGMVNLATDRFSGVQWGAVNISRDCSGVQCGFVNYTEAMNGVQIGFANIIKENNWFDSFPDQLAKGFVFVNWSL